MVAVGSSLRAALGSNLGAIPSSASSREQRWLEPLSKSFRCEIRMTPEAQGGYSVYTPQLPGVISEGENAEETVRNMAEALQGALQTYLHDAVPIPWKRDIEPVAEGETRLWIVVNV